MSACEPHSSKKNLAIHILGAAGENHAARYLESLGFKIIAQNYSSKVGEIDLIAQKENTLAFVEVKTRKTHYFHASMLITPAKQRRIARTAQKFVAEHRTGEDLVLRFDAVFVSIKENTVDFEYIPNAFYAPQGEHR